MSNITIDVKNDEMLGRAIEKNLYFELYNRLKEKDKEIERLNNVINESDKMIDKIVEEVYKPVDKEWDNILCIIEDYKLKLQELKGDGSNEKNTNE